MEGDPTDFERGCIEGMKVADAKVADLTRRLAAAVEGLEHYADGANWDRTRDDAGRLLDDEDWYIRGGNGYDIAESALRVAKEK